MNKIRFKTLVIFLLICIVIIWYIFTQHRFTKEIDKEIAAAVYINDEVVEQTTITIKGKKHKTYLSDKEFYDGLFAIGYYKITYRDGVTARITWNNAPGIETQRLSYYHVGDFTSFDLTGLIIIDEEMNEIALGFKDGTIIATSDALYLKYKK
ncbi:MAG: hypothetical protein AB2392_23520 [Neobacillus sp.]|jgi:hypothetical protein